VRFGRHTLEVRETPGHTAGCVSYLCVDEGMAFTGDALLIRAAAARFPAGGRAHALRIGARKLLSLPEGTRLYPGHDYRGAPRRPWRRSGGYNPRLGDGRSLEQFVELMDRLNLPTRAHGRSGARQPRVRRDGAQASRRAWSEETTGRRCAARRAGVHVVTCEWLAAHRGEVRVVDVREHVEFCGPLGTSRRGARTARDGSRTRPPAWTARRRW